MLARRHPFALLSDYVLDLLPAAERKLVERHLAECDACLRRVREERAMARAIRTTLRDTDVPSGSRLAELMPAPPADRRKLVWKGFWRPALALSLLFIIFLGTVQLQQGSGGALAYPSPTMLSVTATATPTSTAGSADGAGQPAPETVPGATVGSRPAGTPVASWQLAAQ